MQAGGLNSTLNVTVQCHQFSANGIDRISWQLLVPLAADGAKFARRPRGNQVARQIDASDEPKGKQFIVVI